MPGDDVPLDQILKWEYHNSMPNFAISFRFEAPREVILVPRVGPLSRIYNFFMENPQFHPEQEKFNGG